ncbi:hypothetical protein Tsubulata_035690 [Turnera subulata]|uniref:Serine-rich protein-like protein n=1 Tax=Turnera subulata TaxID=218843 RepID=A0A9Q0J0U0_9ROSI|nr:hypothetical protein Tsubulata_035690 [Turnera subulata]
MAMASSRAKSKDPHLSTHYSPPPPSISQSSAFSSTSTSTSTFFARATSPSRVRFSPHVSSATTASASTASQSSLRFSIDHRPISPGRSISVTRHHHHHRAANAGDGHKRTCLCSPTNHPGSFRCAFHRSLAKKSGGYGNRHDGNGNGGGGSSSFRALHFRRSAMTNSLVRIGGVEGELVKRALSALIRPSSHHLRRRSDFQPRPSRLSVMSKADGL